MGSGAKSYMRKGFLIQYTVRKCGKYFTIYSPFTGAHLRPAQLSNLYPVYATNSTPFYKL